MICLMPEKFKFLKKTALIFGIGPRSPPCPGATTPYLRQAVNRQPGYRLGTSAELLLFIEVISEYF